ncbi:Por secretion system C-terminal sorting domain-containing protein [Dokdonia pacifica]|uniref:Por secretion system C-terminal sorting domain-containing protein n=2 Tax=Dokdonia pacifica TaxID=1627892 RepID=A0A238W277_9FLAO|nr:Por secretion system C-terminal sorting domain-containing protein [Dokdonia pacifica]
MKKQLFFITCISLMVSQSVFAQFPVLFEGEWKLELLTIDGEDFVPPMNDEVEMIGLVFEEESEGIPPVFDTYVCNGFFGFLSFQEETGMLPSFSFDEYSMTLIECDLSENSVFENLYFNFYLNGIEDVFEYDIIYLGNAPTLSVYNTNGDAAFYGNPFLSLRDNTLPSFSIYPNPVQSQLYIETDSQEDYTITVFDIQGRMLITTSKEALGINSIDVQHWKSGLYFLRIEDQKGKVTAKRFLKN